MKLWKIMGKSFLSLVLFLVYVPALLAQHYDIVYRISNFYDTSLKARVTVDTRHLGPFIIVKSKESRSKPKQPDKQVICADNGQLIEYGRSQVCSQVYWFIDFYNQPKDGIRGSAQSDIFLNNNQWLLTESGNFPRFLNTINAAACVSSTHCQVLSKQGLSLFFVWGKNPTIIRLPKQTIKLYTDKAAEALDKTALIKQLEPGFDYIYQVFNSRTATKRPDLSIIWLARSHTAKTSGGLAGYNAFMANYYVDEQGKIIQNKLATLLKVSLHEYVHVFSANRFNTWIEESLADYYSYKAYESGAYNEHALTLWQDYKANEPSAAVGLYMADIKVKRGDFSYYTLFYIKGAAFWNEIDRELIKQGQTLDLYIQDLTHKQSTYNTELPQKFISSVSAVIGKEKLSQLINEYLMTWVRQ